MTMIRNLIVLLITTFLCLSTKLSAQELSTYRWTTLEATGDAVGRHENAFVEFEGKFYLIGGRGINPVNVFDPASKSWETKQKTPFEIHHFQAVVHKDHILLVGAMTGGYPHEKPIGNIWKYYPKEDKWEEGSEIPAEMQRGGAGAVIYKNKLYLVCGIKDGHTSGTMNRFDSYDLSTGEWEAHTRAPHLRDHFSAIVVEDKLYCIGGRNTSVHNPDNFGAFFWATTPHVDVYDFETSQWITLEEKLPYPTAAGGILHLNNCLIYMGGEGSQKQAYNQTQCLDLASGQWSQLAPMNMGRHGSAAILYQDKVYISAGSQHRGGGNMNSVEVFEADHDWVSLFNGEDLTGWEVKCIAADKDKTFWTVEDGMIVANSLGSKDHSYMWLMHEKEYENFELRLKFQASRIQKGNSGVQFRSRYEDEAIVENDEVGWLDGPQADINPNAPWRNGLIYDESRETKRWIHPSLPNWEISEKDTDHKVNFYFEDEETGWNDMTIICKDMRIKVIVNNIVVSEYYAEGILNDDKHQKYGVGTIGHIALQLHKNDENLIRFKDIEIREIGR